MNDTIIIKINDKDITKKCTLHLVKLCLMSHLGLKYAAKYLIVVFGDTCDMSP